MIQKPKIGLVQAKMHIMKIMVYYVNSIWPSHNQRLIFAWWNGKQQKNNIIIIEERNANKSSENLLLLNKNYISTPIYSNKIARYRFYRKMSMANVVISFKRKLNEMNSLQIELLLNISQMEQANKHISQIKWDPIARFIVEKRMKSLYIIRKRDCRRPLLIFIHTTAGCECSVICFP